MYAGELARFLHERLGRLNDLEKTLKRFESLRSYRRLPGGQENSGVRLTNEQISSAVLGFVPESPSAAGHVSLCLGSLQPLGGKKASFHHSENVVQALGTILETENGWQSLARVEFSIGEDPSRDEYGVRFVVCEGGDRRNVSFVSSLATSSLIEGAERTHDHDRMRSAVIRQLVLGPEFFRDLSRKISLSRSLAHPPSQDWRGYETEEARRAFHRRLGAHPSSRFLNVPVETQVTWPSEPTRLRFADHWFVLFPKTREHSHSISIDLRNEQISTEDARTLMNRMLSLMCWCDDQFAILGNGWSGNSIPVPVPKQESIFATSYNWLFDRSIPKDEELLHRLAYYREGLNAHKASLFTFEVLSFYKVFEVRRSGTRREENPTKKWIDENFDEACRNLDARELARFDAGRGTKSAGAYIYDSYRLATAHTSAKSPSDADSTHEIGRLYGGGRVMKALARHFISQTYKLSGLPFEDIA
jgi:hypothetical protein